MNKEKRFNRIFGIIALALFLIFVVWKFYSSNKKAETLTDHLNQEYELISIDTEIDSKISNTYYPNEWRGSEFYQYITLTDGKKVQIHIKDNVTSKETYFKDIAKDRARVIKKAGSDTLAVISRFYNEQYLFTIKTNR